MEAALRLFQLKNVKDKIIYRVAPNRSLERWAVIEEGRRSAKPKARGLSKSEALDFVIRLARKKAQPARVLIHKTRYIIEQQLQLKV